MNFGMVAILGGAVLMASAFFGKEKEQEQEQREQEQEQRDRDRDRQEEPDLEQDRGRTNGNGNGTPTYRPPSTAHQTTISVEGEPTVLTWSEAGR